MLQSRITNSDLRGGGVQAYHSGKKFELGVGGKVRTRPDIFVHTCNIAHVRPLEQKLEKKPLYGLKDIELSY